MSALQLRRHQRQWLSLQTLIPASGLNLVIRVKDNARWAVSGSRSDQCLMFWSRSPCIRQSSLELWCRHEACLASLCEDMDIHVPCLPTKTWITDAINATLQNLCIKWWGLWRRYLVNSVQSGCFHCAYFSALQGGWNMDTKLWSHTHVTCDLSGIPSTHAPFPLRCSSTNVAHSKNTGSLGCPLGHKPIRIGLAALRQLVIAWDAIR